MKTKNKSYRTCLISNKQYERDLLVRLVKINNKLVVDPKKNKPGRGYWLKIDKNVLSDPKLITILSKRTKSSVDENLINDLRKLL